MMKKYKDTGYIYCKNQRKKINNVVSKNNVLIKTEIFQNFSKKNCKGAHGFNPLFCQTAPSFTWNAGSKISGVRIEYITDDKLRSLLQNLMRSGPASVMGSRFVKRNDK